MARGFLAAVQRDLRAAARSHQRAQRAAVRDHNAAVRRADQARRAEERAHAQFLRSSEAERKRLEKEEREAHIESREAEAEERNTELLEIYDEIDSLLAATLEVDDYVDLGKLRAIAEHPPFERPDLEAPIPIPEPMPDPPQPTLSLPRPLGAFGRLFGKRRHAAAIVKANEDHERAVSKWQAEIESLKVRRHEASEDHARAESQRVATLKSERARYDKECATREADVAERNATLDQLIANLGYGAADAIQEYVSIVLSNSVYPDHFPVTHEFDFEPTSAEMRLRVLVPGPETIPKIKAYKYTKAADEITTTPLAEKVCRDRYAGAVHQVALRSIHEVFESDRRGIIKTISLEVGTEAVDPATGRQGYMPFVVAAAERESFLKFDLSAVIPARTLERLGAAVSKNPYGFVSVERSGVRRS